MRLRSDGLGCWYELSTTGGGELVEHRTGGIDHCGSGFDDPSGVGGGELVAQGVEPRTQLVDRGVEVVDLLVGYVPPALP